MIQHGVVELLGTQCPEGGTVHPIRAVVKHSDKYKAGVLTGIELRNQNDLHTLARKLPPLLTTPCIPARLT
jgi:hypothetical protein